MQCLRRWVLNNRRLVLRDSPVLLAISCNDTLSRRCMRRILPNISMAITLFVLCVAASRELTHVPGFG